MQILLHVHVGLRFFFKYFKTNVQVVKVVIAIFLYKKCVSKFKTSRIAILYHHTVQIIQYNIMFLAFILCALGVSIYIQENPTVVLVVTDIMKRAQALQSSKEIIFVDSTSSCDSTRVNVAQLLTATKAGAMPIATLLHYDASAAGYSAAFHMLKRHCPDCFGGQSCKCYLLI